MPRSADASSSPLHVSPGVRTSHNTLTSHRRARFLRGLSHQGPVSQQASPGQRGTRPRLGALTASWLRRPRSHRRAASSRRRTLPDGGRMSRVTPHSLRHVPLQGLRMATCPARLARGRRCPDGVPWTSPNSRPRTDGRRGRPSPSLGRKRNSPLPAPLPAPQAPVRPGSLSGDAGLSPVRPPGQGAGWAAASRTATAAHAANRTGTKTQDSCPERGRGCPPPPAGPPSSPRWDCPPLAGAVLLPRLSLCHSMSQPCPHRISSGWSSPAFDHSLRRDTVTGHLGFPHTHVSESRPSERPR